MILDDIRNFLVAQGLVTTQWPCFEGYIVDTSTLPDQMIACFETGGLPPDTMNREYERVNFQIRVRASRLNYLVGRTQWLNVFNAIQDSSLGQYPKYALVQALHYGPVCFNDDKGRPNFISNFRVVQQTETS